MEIHTSEKEDDPRTKRIIAAAIEIHRILGPGLLEAVYEDAMEIEFKLRGIPFKRQAPLPIYYKGFKINHQHIEYIVEDVLPVELKSLRINHEYFGAQMLSYLMGAGLRIGLVLNFGLKRLADGIIRVAA